MRSRITAKADEADDYDSPWKEVLEQFFPEFMAFFFPDADRLIDWSKGYEFLDQELRAVVQDAELGRRFVDKLVRVTLLTGEEDFLYIHIEVQGAPEQQFGERIFVYNYRLYDRYRRPVASLAVLADDSDGWRPDQFGYEALGCRVGIRFPIVKLLDYAGAEGRLLAADNPFGLVTAAHLMARATRRDMPMRLDAKWRLVRILYGKGWSRDRIIALFAVLDWMMRLPHPLHEELWRRLEVLERETRMRYVTSVEQIGYERGVKAGIEQVREADAVSLRDEAKERAVAVEAPRAAGLYDLET
ncbi:MAG: cytosolic protein [Acidobacteria bacterium]|nr:cytosolic protein [Acidobacteriota bacterium]